MNHLSLFSGYEGFGLGLRLAGVPILTVGYVEIDKYCQKQLRIRALEGYLDWAPIIADIASADFRPMAGMVDIITAGFPCQPHSVAGKQLGAEDERNLWPDTLRTIGEVGPSWVLLENVPGILANGYAGTVVGQLSEIGYDCEWGIVSAADVGANHLRKRWWVLAYPNNQRLEGWNCGELPECPGQLASGEGSSFPDAYEYREEWSQPQYRERGRTDSHSWWEIEPPLGRVANGVADRVGQLRTLGGGIVPAVVAVFWWRLMEISATPPHS